MRADVGGLGDWVCFSTQVPQLLVRAEDWIVDLCGYPFGLLFSAALMNQPVFPRTDGVFNTICQSPSGEGYDCG